MAENPADHADDIERVRAALLRIAAMSCACGFDWLVLNGLPQLLLLHPDPSRRSLGEIDLLVPPGQSMAIADIFRANGLEAVKGNGRQDDLGRRGLRSDPRTTLWDRQAARHIHLHERRFFADSKVAPLLARHPPRRSRSPDDICAEPVGAEMALDILLRGSARQWRKRGALLDLAAVLGLLDRAQQVALLHAAAAAAFAPGALASLIALRTAMGIEPPAGPLRTWLDQAEIVPEVAVRASIYAEAIAAHGPAEPTDAPHKPAIGRPRPWQRIAGRMARVIRRPRQFTRDPATRMDRYPLAFRFAQHWLRNRDQVRILSFGCSSGEEVLSLRSYFPDAAIKGIDVDRRRIAAARALIADRPGIALEVAGTAAGEPAGSYDAVFCMAVLRDAALDSPRTRAAAGLLTFAAFAAEIAALVRCLKPGGLLFVAHSNFRVADTDAAGQLELVLHADPPGSGLTPGLYDRTGSRLDNEVDRSLAFVKLAQ